MINDLDMQSIRPKYVDLKHLLVVDKPSGINTHQVDDKKPGLVEMLSKFEKLWVIHRLDKGTSGLILFAKSATIATDLGLMFEKAQIKKTYLFLTDRHPGIKEYTAKSNISRLANKFVSDRFGKINSVTHIKFMGQVGAFYLWQAKPETGKPHQIRLHAADLQMPIVGDADHGGIPFVQLALHCSQLQFKYRDEDHNLTSSPPFWTTKRDYSEMELNCALEKRMRILQFSDQDCIRISHRENVKFQIDQYGPVYWVYWYDEKDPGNDDFRLFAELCKRFGRSLYIRKMLNRGKNSNKQLLWNIGDPPENWVSYENGIRYEMRSSSGLSPGLFLDQRENRYWVRENSEGKKVLNLFSYTGGFSLNAAMGGAKEVVSVDLSKSFIEWTKRNFALNEIELISNFEFWTQDVFVFLKGAFRKKRVFDLIVCDPPSFGRSKERIFKLDKDLPELLQLVWKV